MEVVVMNFIRLTNYFLRAKINVQTTKDYAEPHLFRKYCLVCLLVKMKIKQPKYWQLVYQTIKDSYYLSPLFDQKSSTIDDNTNTKMQIESYK